MSYPQRELPTFNDASVPQAHARCKSTVKADVQKRCPAVLASSVAINEPRFRETTSCSPRGLQIVVAACLWLRLESQQTPFRFTELLKVDGGEEQRRDRNFPTAYPKTQRVAFSNPNGRQLRSHRGKHQNGGIREEIGA